MHIVALAWIFVVVLMAAAEAGSTQGTPLGALFTLLLYGALPLTVVLYVMGAPARRRNRRAAEQAEQTGLAEPESSGAADPPLPGSVAPGSSSAGRSSTQAHDGRSQPASTPVAPVGKEP